MPRLWYGTAEERDNFEIIGDGALIHCLDLDEDLSVSGILAGRRFGESQKMYPYIFLDSHLNSVEDFNTRL